MKFEELYKKYQNGTATREERAYVENELAMANEITEIVNSGPQIAKADEDDIKKIKKTFRWKTFFITGIVTTLVIIVVVGIVLGVLFGVSVPAAKKNIKLNRNQAIEIAIAELEKAASSYGEFLRIDDCDLDLEIESPLQDSYYKYEIELNTKLGYEITYHVSAKDGQVYLAHIDY